MDVAVDGFADISTSGEHGQYFANLELLRFEFLIVSCEIKCQPSNIHG